MLSSAWGLIKIDLSRAQIMQHWENKLKKQKQKTAVLCIFIGMKILKTPNKGCVWGEMLISEERDQKQLTFLALHCGMCIFILLNLQ